MVVIMSGPIKEKLTGGWKTSTTKCFIDSSISEDGFRDINSSVICNNTYQILRSMINLGKTKIDTKCKNLTNFSAVALRALC